ncbi:MAG: type 4 prepilin peptidase 1 [Candidatus Peregrinibacteria bacterium Greene0416_62]|nr:MAG: type 4 prepilin peptidase 1 [Candidatus Peregrinibacteria bacterium Greene0416_62]TSC99810.1 MAG: type 4 prepilin peptidase 1 [Candidatus Peregrinibacteria bacterium Greene1014_49]
MPLSVFSLGLLFLFGLALGSFGSVVVSRVPKNKSIGGRSQCPHCKQTIAARDLIPVLSFLILEGRCRHCRKNISLCYPLLELSSAGLIILPAILEGYIDPFTVSLGTALWLFLLLAVMDSESQRIPDVVSMPLIVVAFLAAYLRGEISWLAPLMGGGFFLLQWAVSRGRILGSGDIFIGIAMGCILGTWPITLLAVGIAYVVGASIACYFLASGKYTRGMRIAFVPYLFVGTVIALVFGERVLKLLSI